MKRSAARRRGDCPPDTLCSVTEPPRRNLVVHTSIDVPECKVAVGGKALHNLEVTNLEGWYTPVRAVTKCIGKHIAYATGHTFESSIVICRGDNREPVPVFSQYLYAETSLPLGTHSSPEQAEITLYKHRHAPDASPEKCSDIILTVTVHAL